MYGYFSALMSDANLVCVANLVRLGTEGEDIAFSTTAALPQTFKNTCAITCRVVNH